MNLRFLKPVLILTVIVVAIAVWPLATFLSEFRSEAVAAGVIAVTNTVLGLLIIELTIDKPNFIFMSAFFGGMAVRVFLVLFVFALLLWQGFDGLTLTFFMMGLYFMYLTIEIRYLVRVLNKSKRYKS